MLSMENRIYLGKGLVNVSKQLKNSHMKEELGLLCMRRRDAAIN